MNWFLKLFSKPLLVSMRCFPLFLKAKKEETLMLPPSIPSPIKPNTKGFAHCSLRRFTNRTQQSVQSSIRWAEAWKPLSGSTEAEPWADMEAVVLLLFFRVSHGEPRNILKLILNSTFQNRITCFTAMGSSKVSEKVWLFSYGWRISNTEKINNRSVEYNYNYRML